MMGIMGTPQQPLDFTTVSTPTDHCQTVLDLRKVVKDDPNRCYEHLNVKGTVVNTMSPTADFLQQTRILPQTVPYFPSATYFGHHQQHNQYNFSGRTIRRDSSEDAYSERGSVSPPPMSVCSSSSSPPTRSYISPCSPPSAASLALPPPPPPPSPPSGISSTSPPHLAITNSIINGSISRNGKPTRPFKAYPKDPLSLPVVSTAEAILGQASNEAYTEFRRRMLSQVQAVTNNTTNSKMKRCQSPNQSQLQQQQHQSQATSCIDNELISNKDAAYWERRRKNNEAAKRSRDARRAKEDEIAIRAAFLEQENIQLKYENATLRNEAAKLRCLLYNR